MPNPNPFSEARALATSLPTARALAMFLALLTLPILWTGQAHAVSPSFDCARASSDDEIAICSSNELSEMDNIVAAGYAHLRNSVGTDQAKSVALSMLKLRRACGGDVDCILQRQKETVLAFQQLGAPILLPDWLANSGTETALDAMPQTIGGCVNSTISEIGGRLQGDTEFGSGTAVGFANGGWQVSYDRIFEIIRSTIGDPVEICLVEVPPDCPPGDDRGKIYETTNLNTGDKWTLPDSQHSCGGA